MQRVLIIGAGGHGRETADLLRQRPGDFCIEGFIDDDPATHGSEVEGYRVLGDSSVLEATDPDRFSIACGIGFPQVRRRVIERVEALGFSVVGVISPLAYVSPSAKIGPGVAIWPFASIGPGADIGDHAMVYHSAFVAHESSVGRYSIVCPGAQIAGNVHVGEEAWVGLNSAIIQGRTVGERAVIGAGAAVTRDIPAGSTAAGVPAKVIK